MKYGFWYRCLVIFIALTCVKFVYAEIYKWTDADGKTHFSDAPPAGNAAEAVDVKINTYTSVEVTPLLERLGREDKVVMYTAAWCKVCTKAKNYFTERGIPYVAYDVEKSPVGRVDFKALRGKSVPVIIIGRSRMNGFTAARFDKLYEKEMRERQQRQAETEAAKQNN